MGLGRAWGVSIAVALAASACGSSSDNPLFSGGSGGIGGFGGDGGGGAGGAGGSAGASGAAGAGGGGCTANLATDGENCGACGHSCLGGQCLGGGCQPALLANGLSYPYRIAVDDASVIISSVGDSNAGSQAYNGAILHVPIGGGAATSLTSGVAGAFTGLALDASRVYVVMLQQSGSALLGAEKSGSGSAQIATGVNTGFLALNVPGPTATASTVFYGKQASVYSSPALGGSSTLIGTGVGSAAGIAADPSGVYWADSGTYDANGIAVGNGELLHAVAGGAVNVLDAQAGEPNGIAIDATHVYYVDVKGGRVLRVPKDGSGQREVLTTGQAFPYAVVLDGSNVYWTNHGAELGSKSSCAGAGALMTMPKSGGAVRTLAGSRNCPTGIAADAKAIYWVDAGTAPYNASKDGVAARLAK